VGTKTERIKITQRRKGAGDSTRPENRLKAGVPSEHGEEKQRKNKGIRRQQGLPAASRLPHSTKRAAL
jgi:hypothetical protein